MTQYNSLNVNFLIKQLSKLKGWMKNCTEVPLNLSLNVIPMMRLNSDIKYYWLTDKFEVFVTLFQIIHQLI